MIPAGKLFRKLVLICTNERPDGQECCAARGSIELHKKIKEAVKLSGVTDIRVSKSGCLDNCKTGSTVVIMPDNIWLGQVTEEDIPELLILILQA